MATPTSQPKHAPTHAPHPMGQPMGLGGCLGHTRPIFNFFFSCPKLQSKPSSWVCFHSHDEIPQFVVLRLANVQKNTPKNTTSTPSHAWNRPKPCMHLRNGLNTGLASSLVTFEAVDVTPTSLSWVWGKNLSRSVTLNGSPKPKETPKRPELSHMGACMHGEHVMLIWG
jgi:hypothetical protein